MQAQLTTAALAQVRSLLDRMLQAGEDPTMPDLADQVTASCHSLIGTDASVDALVDHVVADQVRHTQPRLAADHTSMDLNDTIADLVIERVDIDDRLDRVWHLIGRGDTSAREFETLRSTLTVDIGHRFAHWFSDLSAEDRRQAVRAIDSALSLAAVREIRRHRMESVFDARRILFDEVQRLCERVIDVEVRTGLVSRAGVAVS